MPVDSAAGHSFGLEHDGILIRGIRRVDGLRLELDVIELKQNGPDGKLVVRRLPGGWKPGEVTVTRGLSRDGGFESWLTAAHVGRAREDRTKVSIIVFDREGATVKRYELVDAWPRSLQIVLPDAGDTTALAEELVITYARVQVG